MLWNMKSHGLPIHNNDSYSCLIGLLQAKRTFKDELNFNSLEFSVFDNSPDWKNGGLPLLLRHCIRECYINVKTDYGIWQFLNATFNFAFNTNMHMVHANEMQFPFSNQMRVNMSKNVYISCRNVLKNI